MRGRGEPLPAQLGAAQSLGRSAGQSGREAIPGPLYPCVGTRLWRRVGQERPQRLGAAAGGLPRTGTERFILGEGMSFRY